MIVAVALLLGGSDFEYFLAVRDFQAAAAIAENDSMRAVVERAAGRDSLAREIFREAFEAHPSPGLFTECWKPSKTGARLRGTPEEFAEALLRWKNVFHWKPEHLSALSETALALGDSTLADSLGNTLLEMSSSSHEAYDYLGSKFYESLYPVWNDDSARITVLRNFLEKLGNADTPWRSTAYAWLSSSLRESSTGTRKKVTWEWIEACPGDPRAILAGAVFLLEEDSAAAEALELAKKGIGSISGG